VIENLRNIAIIAHVDHGKTTLVDKLLSQSGTLDRKAEGQERIMDSNDQEKERGITILAKNTAIQWQDGNGTGYHINIVDTPGHADFGGEVERVMSMVDSVLLLVDAVDGPMPQTRFVTQKAFSQGLKPIVVVNKIDRPGARPDWVIDQIFDLFDNLGATDEQLDFPIIYCSALNGIAGMDPEALADNMDPMFQAIVDIVEPPKVEVDGPFQMQISALDYNSYVGVIGLGRIKRGSVKPNQQISVISVDGTTRKGKIGQVMTHMGLERVQTTEATAGDIVCITGIEDLAISDTLCDPSAVEALPPLSVDEPTVSMTFQVNDSPFAGKDGKFVTSRNIKDRLDQELIHNVALRVEQGETPEKFKVSGRGELHLTTLELDEREQSVLLRARIPRARRVAVFRGAVQLALGDGQLSNGEKRLLVKMAHALRLEENDPKRVYDAVVAGEDLATGTVLGLEETRRVYEQVLEAFLLHTDRSEDELILVAYLRHSFAIDDAEHRAIARSMDRQLEHVVHRTVAEEIRMRLDDTLDRIGTIFDEIRLQN